MADDFIRFAFTGGVFSEALLGRSDVEKYDLGLAAGLNWFIHYQGGASTRPGTQFLDYVQDDDQPVRLAEFKYSSRIADVYLLVFSLNRLRFMQNGAYVLESQKNISAISTSGVFTSNAHGYVNGDWVKLIAIAGAGTYEVTAASTNTFRLKNPDGTFLVPTETYSSAMKVARIYTLASPFAVDDLAELHFSQIRDEVIITHLDYPPYKLSRVTATNWTITPVDLAGNTTAPGTLTLTPQTSGSAGVLYGVTAVNLAGEESYVSNFKVTEATNNFTSTAGSVKLTWTAMTDVQYYNVYRSIVFPVGADALVSQELGFIGRSKAPEFTDANIVPDFTTPPPTFSNPFVQGAITAINMTAAGTGYSKSTATVTVTGSGSGFVGKPVVNGAGTIIGVLIINPGSGYVNPVVSFGGGGAGATATAVAGAVSGTYPRCSVLLQQRRVYAGTELQPMTLFGSRPGQPENFSTSLYGSADDSFELTLDAADVNPIKFCVAFPSGLVAFTENAVHLVRGSEDKTISPLTAMAEPLSGTGIASTPPLYIEDEILYVTNAGTEVRLLRPVVITNQTRSFSTSLYSTDFFSKQNVIQSWGFAKEPFRLLWAQRRDGTFLSMTYLLEQNVFAWSNHDTQGIVKQITTLAERGRDRVYMVVERKIGTTWRKYIERFGFRDVSTVERMYAVDCGLQLDLPNPDAVLTVTETTASTSSDVFTADDIGAHLRAGDGRAVVVSVVDPKNAVIAWQIALTERVPQTSEFRTYASGDWSLARKYSTVGNLHHLEGKTVQVFADGNWQADQVVENGSITLSSRASLVAVGLSFTAELKTLPLHAADLILAAKNKRVVGAALRLLETRGLSVGDGETFYDMKDRTNEALDEPARFQSGVREIAIASSWEFDGSLTVRKTGPMNATLLGLVLKAEKSDD